MQEEVGAGAAGSVAVATGMALAGLRATAFLRGDELHSAHEALHFAADRLAPLVVHVANGDGGHAGYHAVAGAGLFQVLPSSGQEAIDLSLLARWLAERALVPGIVASDGYAVERLRLPGEEMVRAYLRRPDAATPSPTEAQRIVFGTDRPRLLRWFDAERPVATGGMRTELAEAGARLGRRFFFWDHVAELARQGMDELAELTGRPLSFLHRYRLDDAEVVIVAQGAAAEVARAVAAYARRVRHWKVGVVGVTWLRPLPVAELAAALGDRRPVAVVEPADDALAGEPPLFREVRAAVGASDGWISATSAGTWPDPARLLALCELLRRRERPRRVQLERAALPESTGFPRRDALLQRAANGYSGLGSPDLPESESLGIEPKGGRSLALIGREGELPPDALTLFAQAAADACGRFVHGTATRPEPGAWQAQIRAAPAEFLDPGPRDPVGLLLVATDSPRDLGHPLTSVRPGAAVVLATADSPERIWHRLPAAWCREVRERELRVFTVAPAFEAGIAAVAALLRGDEAASLRDGSLREVRWRELEAREPTERELPELVRRIEKVRAAHDSLPRFWGEVVQPRQGGASNGIDDPITASGAVPAGASALDPEPAAAVLPAFDPALCTGCGRCWSACPDAAIGVTVLGSEPLLTAASRVARSEGRVADALRRAHKHLAGRMATEIVKNGAEALSSETCRDAWRWVSSRMDISEADRPEYEAIMGTTIQVASQLQPAVTRPFFHDAEDQGKGKGELLVLAVDPRACQGCNLCVETCPEQALRPLERTHDRYIEFAERWRAWEALPDSPGDTLARAAKHPDVGPLPAALLSRHCAQAQVGGGPGGEPGSGERLAGRLVAAFVEQHAQQQVTHLLGRLEKERETLKQKLSERLSESLSTATPDTLADALARVTRGRAALSELGEQLDALGAPATFDRRSLLRMARLAGEMDRYRQRLVAGEDGLGRARFGVVVTHGSVAEWAARFPGNPYYAPLTLAPTRAGVELARGIARGLVADHLQLQRTL
ncbi:MAG: 4Fe-4S binding protein, partial [Deltaproteobacteria bacterium]